MQANLTPGQFNADLWFEWEGLDLTGCPRVAFLAEDLEDSIFGDNHAVPHRSVVSFRFHNQLTFSTVEGSVTVRLEM